VVEEIENVIDTSPVEEFFQTNGPSTNKWSAASAPCSHDAAGEEALKPHEDGVDITVYGRSAASKVPGW
jgi:hypothetical protein